MIELLPRSWRRELEAARWQPVSSGLSGASVWRLLRDSSRGSYLKLGTGSHAEAVRQEIIRTAWLHAHGANVPPISRTLIRPDFAALLMAALPSEPIQGCDLPPKRVVEILARALSDLHSLPVASCPFDETIQTRLERAQKAVAEQRVDPAQFRTENLKMTPEELFRRVVAGVPATEDLVVVHGDATFTNILIDGLQHVGFVDCGHAGRGDRYIDLALAASEIEERYGKDWTPAFCKAYGLSNWDARKAEFFLDLYEFF